MDYRPLGRSGLKVPVLSFGAGTFGGKGPLFSAWGNTDVNEARRLIEICLDAGVNLFDTRRMSIQMAHRKKFSAPRSRGAATMC
jgi:aryl-alcohol dehydrogenase-like predicted oxidoreductase